MLCNSEHKQGHKKRTEQNTKIHSYPAQMSVSFFLSGKRFIWSARHLPRIRKDVESEWDQELGYNWNSPCNTWQFLSSIDQKACNQFLSDLLFLAIFNTWENKPVLASKSYHNLSKNIFCCSGARSLPVKPWATESAHSWKGISKAKPHRPWKLQVCDISLYSL